MSTMSFDEECRISIALEVVTPGVEIRGVVALFAEETIRYRAVHDEPFKAPVGGFYLVTVRIAPQTIEPGAYSARIGAQLLYEGELSRIVRGDAFSFEVLPLDSEEEPAAQVALNGDGAPPAFVDLDDAEWSVQRGRKAQAAVKRWGT